MSQAMTVWPTASAGAFAANMREEAAKPWVSTIAGPDPVTSAWMRTPPSCPIVTTLRPAGRAAAREPSRTSSASVEDPQHRGDLVAERGGGQLEVWGRGRFVGVVD